MFKIGILGKKFYKINKKLIELTKKIIEIKKINSFMDGKLILFLRSPDEDGCCDPQAPTYRDHHNIVPVWIR